MKTVYLVRHGEAENNIKNEDLFRGGQSKLTLLGHQQAEAVAQRVQRLKLDHIISSSMLRARETAAHIAEAVRVPVEVSDLFTERRPPQSFLKLRKNSSDFKVSFALWEKSFLEDGRHEEGENFDDLMVRARECFLFLEGVSHDNILVVTHGFFMTMLIGYLLLGDSLTKEQFNQFNIGLRADNSGLSSIVYDQLDSKRKWWVHVWNDHAHLG